MILIGFVSILSVTAAYAAASLSFATKVDYSTGSGAYSVVADDFNLDGKLDLATANYISHTVSVLLGNGDGTYADAVDYSTGTGSNPMWLAVGDFNQDGKPDLAAAIYFADKVSVMPGNGDGTFAAPLDFSTGVEPSTLAVGDFNLDSKPDLVVGNYSSNNISILFNTTPDGATTPTFAAKVDIATDAGPSGVAVSDFNRDRKPDFVVTNLDAGNASVLLNMTPPGAATPTFADKTDYAIGDGPFGVAVSDFNGDGRDDLAIANAGANGNNLSVLTGDGAGAFAAKVNYATGIKPMAVAAGDFNRDGMPDLATANYLDGSVGSTSVLINTSLIDRGGTFATKVDYSTGNGAYSVVADDFNLDGKLDLATANYVSSTVSILLGNGDGTYTDAVDYSTGAGSTPRWLAVGDFNRDGKPDLATANYGSTSVGILDGNGDGTFAAVRTYAISRMFFQLVVGDFNRDGKLDLAAAIYVTHKVRVMAGNGDGTFAAPVDFGTGNYPSTLAVGDFNLDSKPDLVVGNYSGDSISILFNTTPVGTATPSFADKVDIATGAGPSGVAVSDFNRDRKPDIVVTNVNADNASVLLNTTPVGAATPTFADKTDYVIGDGPFGVAVSDFNGDGKDDLAIPTQVVNNLSVLTGDGAGAFAAKVNYATGNTPRAVAAGDFNRDGMPDLATANVGDGSVGSTSVLIRTFGAPTATTDAATAVTSGGATLNGTVNANSAATTVTFEYGPTVAYGTSVAATPGTVTGNSNTVVSQTLTGLSPNILYHYRVVGVNAGGTTNGSDQAFALCLSTVTVTNNSDTGAGSLRQAVLDVCSDGTITFGSSYSIALASTLTLSKSLALNAAGTPLFLSGYPVVSSSGTQTLTGNITVDTLTVDSGATLAAGSTTLTVYGDWNRSGTFTPATSTVVFAKSGTQALTGDTTFNNLTINNGTTLDVGQYTLTVNGTLTKHGALANRAPNQSLVLNNPVAFDDAIGKPTVVMTSTGTADLGSTAVGTVMNEAPPQCGGTSAASDMVLRHFAITPTVTSDVAATVRLHFAPEELNGLTANRLAIYHCNGSVWQALSGAYTYGTDGTTGYHYVELSGVTSFSPFALGPATPDIRMFKTASPVNDVAYRGLVTYTLQLNNTGSGADPGVFVTDTLPAGTTFARWVEQSGASVAGNDLSWNGSLAPGTAVTITFQVTNTASGGVTVTNTAWFSGSAQAGSAAAVYTATINAYPSGSGNWSELFGPCAPGCKYVIPAGITVTLDVDISLDGDFEVQPGGGFVPNGKTVTLTGSTPQTLTGYPLTFYNLVVDKSTRSDTVKIVGKLKVTKKMAIKRGDLTSASDYGDVEIEDNGTLSLTNAITIGGNLIVSGTLWTNGNAITFDGGVDRGETVTQTIFLSATTAFGDINVYTNTLLVETSPPNTVALDGTLTNYGTIRNTQPVAGADFYYFGLAGMYPTAAANGMEIKVTDLTGGNPLTAIQVDRIDRPHLHGPVSGGAPIYWTITATGSDFTADVTLPHNNLPTPFACRFYDNVWSCKNSGTATDYVTFGGATAFSEWSVFSCVPAVTVTGNADSGAGSLRQAIADVCAGGSIDFDPALTAGGAATITLTGGQALTLTKNVTINGPGANLLAVSGNAAGRVFVVDAGVAATLDGLTIRDGKLTGPTDGAGILNRGVLTLTNSTLIANNAQNNGAGIYSSGTLAVISSTVANNSGFNGAGIYNTGALALTAAGIAGNTGLSSGGGIYNAGTVTAVRSTFNANQGTMGGGIANAGTLTLTTSIVSANGCTNSGAGVYNTGWLTVEGSRFDANTGGWGAGLYNTGTLTVAGSSFVNNATSGNGGGIMHLIGTLTLHNSTLYSNTAAYGGGIQGTAPLTVTNSTLSGNRSTPGNGGAGIRNYATLVLRNTLIANSTGDADCTNNGTLAENTHNLVEDGTCSPAVSGDPLLGALGDYGGDTPTMPLLPGSPAIDAGDAATCSSADQRGVIRPQGSACDIGAFESRGFTLAKGGGDNQSTPWGRIFAAPLTVAVSSAYTEPVDGGLIIFAGPPTGAGVTPISSTVTILGATGAYTPTANNTLGSYTVTANTAGTLTGVTFILTNTLRATATALQLAPNPALYGESVHFTATVTAPVAGVTALGPVNNPTGNVHFTDPSGTVDLTGTLAAGVATATGGLIPAGSYTVTATYQGDANHSGSTSTSMVLVVNRHGSATALEVVPLTLLVGDSVDVTATVTLSDLAILNGGSITGTVDFFVNGAPVGSVDLANSQAHHRAPASAAGVYTVTATYLGNHIYHPSTSDGVLVTVLKRSTQTALTAVPNPSAVGEAVTFSATVAEQAAQGFVTALGYAPPTPSGEVIFAEGAAELGRGTLVDGTAVFTTSTLAAGDHAITAQYVGDDAFLDSTSDAWSQVVQPVPTAVNDAAGTLQGNAVTVDVLTNDHDPAGEGLEIISLTPAAHGTAEIDRVNQKVVYTPDPAFHGLDSFTYTAEDANGRIDDALVAVVVTARSESGTEPIVAPVDPTQPGRAVFADTHTSTTLDTPVDVYTGTLTDKDIFYLVYTPIITPTGDIHQEPGGLTFGGFIFDLDAYLNDQLLPGYVFPEPITLTISYDPAMLGGLVENSLVVYYWHGTSWDNDGITLVSRDTTNHVVTIRLAHLSELAFFASAPTAAPPDDEPDTYAAHLYLPVIGQQGVTAAEGKVGREEGAPGSAGIPPAGDEPAPAVEAPPNAAGLYLPAVQK